ALYLRCGESHDTVHTKVLQVYHVLRKDYFDRTLVVLVLVVQFTALGKFGGDHVGREQFEFYSVGEPVALDAGITVTPRCGPYHHRLNPFEPVVKWGGFGME